MSQCNHNLPPLPPEFEAHISALLDEREFVTEYQLMKHLVALGFEQFQPSHDSLALFRAHFLLFHMLYRLQDKWFQDQRGWLSIHATEICLHPDRPDRSRESCNPTDVADYDPIKAYYLDYNEFLQTQEEDVVRLLNEFWEGFGRLNHSLAGTQEVEQACELMSLSADGLSEKTVKSRFRALSQQHHPDKGGDPEQFRALCDARALLLAQC